MTEPNEAQKESNKSINILKNIERFLERIFGITKKYINTYPFSLISTFLLIFAIIIYAIIGEIYLALELKGTERNFFISLGTIFGLILLTWRSISADKQAQNTEKTIENTNRQLELTNASNAQTLYEKGVTLLSSKSIPISVAGIKALQKLASDHSSEYLKIVIELLTDFIKYESWPSQKDIINHPFKDNFERSQFLQDINAKNCENLSKFNNLPRCKENVQAALIAISQLRTLPYFEKIELKDNYPYETLEINSAYLCGIDLYNVDLGAKNKNNKKSIIDFSHSILNNAKIHKTSLDHVSLKDSYLNHAEIMDCSLNCTNLENSSLQYALINLCDAVTVIFQHSDVLKAHITYLYEGVDNTKMLFDALKNTRNLRQIDNDDPGCVGFIYGKNSYYKEKWEKACKHSDKVGRIRFT